MNEYSLTPVQEVDGLRIKRDDLYAPFGPGEVNGGNADHPADFVEDLLHVTPDKNQRAILDSVAKNQMTSVRSGHGIGKSAVEAWTVIWFMSTRPFPKIPCTAPTQHQLYATGGLAHTHETVTIKIGGQTT